MEHAPCVMIRRSSVFGLGGLAWCAFLRNLGVRAAARGRGKIFHKGGPKCVPWNSISSIVNGSEETPSTITDARRGVKNSDRKARKQSLAPARRCFASMYCLKTRSKAAMSPNQMPTLLPIHTAMMQDATKRVTKSLQLCFFLNAHLSLPKASIFSRSPTTSSNRATMGVGNEASVH